MDLSGSVLLTNFLFGYLVTLWFRTALAAPAIFCVFHYMILWPLWYTDLSGVNLVHYQVTYQIAMWIGVLLGITTSLVMRFPVLVSWPYRHGTVSLAKNTVVCAALIGTQAIYNELRPSMFPWSGGITVLVVAVLYPIMYLFMRSSRKEAFGSDKKLQMFFLVVGVSHLVFLATFFGVDMIVHSDADADQSYGMAWRMGMLAVITLMTMFGLVLAKLVNPHEVLDAPRSSEFLRENQDDQPLRPYRRRRSDDEADGIYASSDGKAQRDSEIPPDAEK